MKPYWNRNNLGTGPLLQTAYHQFDSLTRICENFDRSLNAELIAARHWPVLQTWPGYLLENGMDPANQLCADDFTGHLAHNANLSLMAIRSFAYSCKEKGAFEQSEKYLHASREMVLKWEEKADDGDHYRLAFDRPGTWSQKYNLICSRKRLQTRKSGRNGLFPHRTCRIESLELHGRQFIPLKKGNLYPPRYWL